MTTNKLRFCRQNYATLTPETDILRLTLFCNKKTMNILLAPIYFFTCKKIPCTSFIM